MLLIIAVACSDTGAGRAEAPEDGLPQTAHQDVVDTLKDDLRALRHPSDGAGSAWLDTDGGSSGAAVVSTPGRWALVYEAGPLGIAEGGTIFLQAPPFWGWSTPQTTEEHGYGFTTVTTTAEGVILQPRTIAPELLAIEVTGRALATGERVRIVYGAGPRGAIADRYAERASRFWIAVDGDGDGIRALLSDSPSIDVRPAAPARLQLILPSSARPGETASLTVAILDAVGNAGVDVTGEVTLIDPPQGIDVPERIRLTPADAGHRTVSVVAREPGIYRLRATGPGGLSAESNPLEVSAKGPRIRWGDLHGHSNYSDGTGLPEDYFSYARDVSALDVVSLTDHDHWGMQFIDRHPELWEEIRAQARRFYEPNRFVTLLGYEWTNWIHGHRHVLYFSDAGQVYSSLDPSTETPASLWKALAGSDALTIAHHSAGGPIATNWAYAPDPVLEPVTEVVSVHGSSEAMDSPARIYAAVPGNFVRDALDRGYRLGFLGSGDSHDGHPGNAHLAGPTGGLAAILTDELTREGILKALRARRVYATSGARIVLRTSLGTTRMGGVLSTSGQASTHDLALRVIATAPLVRVDIVRSGAQVGSLPCNGVREFTAIQPIAGLRAGEYVYVRVLQEDGALAWSSPVFVE